MDIIKVAIQKDTHAPSIPHRCPLALLRLIIRGIERKTIFTDDADRYEFIERIESIFLELARYIHLNPLGASEFVENVLKRCNEIICENIHWPFRV